MIVHDQVGTLDSRGSEETRVTHDTRAMLLHLPHEIQIEFQVVVACEPGEPGFHGGRFCSLTRGADGCLDEPIVDYKWANPRERAAALFQNSMDARRGIESDNCHEKTQQNQGAA